MKIKLSVVLVATLFLLFGNAQVEDSCICEGSTNRIAKSSLSKPLATSFDSWWLDAKYWLVEKRFLRRSAIGMMLIFQ